MGSSRTHAAMAGLVLAATVLEGCRAYAPDSAPQPHVPVKPYSPSLGTHLATRLPRTLLVAHYTRNETGDWSYKGVVEEHTFSKQSGSRWELQGLLSELVPRYVTWLEQRGYTFKTHPNAFENDVTIGRALLGDQFAEVSEDILRGALRLREQDSTSLQDAFGPTALDTAACLIHTFESGIISVQRDESTRDYIGTPAMIEREVRKLR